MGVSDGGVVRFPLMLGEIWEQEYVYDDVNQYVSQHSTVVMTVELIRNNLVYPQSL